MPLPEEDAAIVEQWVHALNARIPPHVAERMRYETEIYRNAITLVEVAPLDFQSPDSDVYRVPFARLRFTRSRGWELYWSDRDSNFHVYEQVEPTQHVTVLLAEIDRDPTGIFFG
jgi:hypothetical protein